MQRFMYFDVLLCENLFRFRCEAHLRCARRQPGVKLGPGMACTGGQTHLSQEIVHDTQPTNQKEP